MNNLQLMDEVKDFKKGETSDDEVEDKVKNAVKSKIFKLHEDQQEVVAEAIEAAKEASGSDVDSVALEYICLDFLGKPFKKKKKAEKKKKEVVEEEVDDDEWEEDDEEIDF